MVRAFPLSQAHIPPVVNGAPIRPQPILLAVLGWLMFQPSHGAARDGAGEDWPRFLGPRANGTSSETALLEHWGSNGPPVVWEREIGAGYGAPSIRDGRLVFHHRIGGEEVVEALE